MTRAKIAAAGIGLFLTAFVLAWPAVALARETSRIADISGTVAGNARAAHRAASFVPPLAQTRPPHADFLGEPVSIDTQRLADWVTASGDNGGLPFVIIDKINARVFVFNRAGRLLGAAPALLGMARGDDTAPGIGSKKLAAIQPQERTTPAGRFVANLGNDLEKKVLWVDYKDALSLHPVIRGNPGDRRFQRLATPTPLDNRISYGCINVPVSFFGQVVLKAFTGTSGIVYILPEIKAIEDVFPMTASASPPIENEAAQSLQSELPQYAPVWNDERRSRPNP